ncbi:MAG TPA: matrixin family metalloprotease [Kofleriaceae bacterium]|nr:matrixin family metalloprotease [Kofleriaceae bacterium]
MVLLLGACTLDESPTEIEIATPDEPLPVDLRAGDVVRLQDLALEVPAAGEAVTLFADGADGSHVELTLVNRDGIVELLSDDAAELEPVIIAASSTAACHDGAFHLSGHKWTTEYQWMFAAGTTPSANSRDNVETALVHAANAIVNSRNDCGLADIVSATTRYLGRTASKPNIPATTSTVSCGTRDNTSSVGFGGLPTTYLGVACTWTDGNGHALEGDVKLSTRHAWFALDVPASCSNRFGVQAVATHEFGHVFGLGHVSEANHPKLTMSTAAAACSNAPYTLGLGDVRALRQLY